MRQREEGRREGREEGREKGRERSETERRGNVTTEAKTGVRQPQIKEYRQPSEADRKSVV